ncbi:hypothetical protein BHM03_00047225 [Ensete ventricosum]|nr:hypothetical protein BHM03_00047225 [Ensete ventricosum]
MGGKKKKKKRKKEEEEKKEDLLSPRCCCPGVVAARASSPLARHRLSRVVAARVSSLLACRRCSRVVASRVSSSLSRRPRLRVILLLCVETERLPAWGERPRLYFMPRFSLPSGKAPYRPICTGMAADRYADRSLSGEIEKGRRRVKEERRRRSEREKLPRAVLTRAPSSPSPPARRRRPRHPRAVVTRGSPMSRRCNRRRRRFFSSRGEKRLRRRAMLANTPYHSAELQTLKMTIWMACFWVVLPLRDDCTQPVFTSLKLPPKPTKMGPSCLLLALYMLCKGYLWIKSEARWSIARFSISICTDRYERYVLVRMIPVRGPPAIVRYRRNRPSAVDFDHRWSIKGERRRGRRRKGIKERDTCSSPVPRAIHRPQAILHRGASFSARGDEARKEKGTPRA